MGRWAEAEIVAVDVIDTVAVAVHVHGNDTVIVAEGAGKTTRADKAKYYTIARGSAMESAAHLDVMRVEELIDDECYAAGVALLERVVAMLTRMIDP